MTTRAQLQSKTIDELRQIADAVGIETDGLQNSKLISALVDAGQVADSSPAEEVDLPQATPRTERVAQDGLLPSSRRAFLQRARSRAPNHVRAAAPITTIVRAGAGIATVAVVVAEAARTSTSPRRT